MASPKELRELNEAALLEVLRHAGAADRAELVEQTGLSRSTVSELVKECILRGVLVEDGEAAGPHRLGRPPTRLRINVSANVAAGADFGRRHLRVALADLAATVLAERLVELDEDAGAIAALDTAARLVAELLDEAAVDRSRLVSAGMGLPAPVNRLTGTIATPSILPAWAALRPADELAERLAVPVRLENDANLAALGEFVHGAGRGVPDAVYLKVSTGIGAGLVLDGSLHTGARGLAGEIGHSVVVPEGVLCRCGNRGCLDTVASTRAVLRALEPVHGPGLTTGRLLALVAGGDPMALGAVAEAGRFLGDALAALCNAVNPAAIIVGGDLGAACEPLRDALRQQLRRNALPRAGDVPVWPAVLGERAEVLGAVALGLGERLARR